MEYIAHLRDSGEIQTVAQHCNSTGKLASDFSVAPLKALNYTIGINHDLGKYTNSFQRRIKGEKIRAPHAMCGAQEIEKNYTEVPVILRKLMEYCISGHHAGIPDIGVTGDSEELPTLYAALNRETEDFSAYREGFVKPELDVKALAAFIMSDCTKNEDIAEKFAFLTRYCFSCLTDADSIDTEEFCTGTVRKPMVADFSECLDKINRILNAFTPVTRLQKTRAILQKQAFEKSGTSSEIYLLNMPTGSGKTLCSIKFALQRAIESKKKRIIYIIPYNSIIEQTAVTFEKIFGSSAQILRHQSTYSYESDSDMDEDYRTTAKKATENWDAQIIITTAVQFFESVYGNKRGKLRKLHNMAESVLVFDEAHLMPKDYLQPCLRAISCITKYLGSEAIFLTATMPNFEQLFKLYSINNTKILNLISDTDCFMAFEKCRYVSLGSIEDCELIAKSSEAPSSLIVVNSRRAAKKLYDLLGDVGEKFHLSTYMTAFDRARVIERIKAALEALERDYPGLENVPEERRITVISTSLIEAGVDLDFHTVYRQLWGLDSILQSGGRCNREGKRENACVYIFQRQEEYGKPLRERTEITKGILEEYGEISSPESIKSYYEKLFFVSKDTILSHRLSNYCGSKPWQIDFRKYSEDFEIIASNTVSVAVGENAESEELVNSIKYGGHCNPRALQKYTFSIYNYELDLLLKQHIIDDFGSGIFCLTNPDYYSSETGISFEAKDYIV